MVLDRSAIAGAVAMTLAVAASAIAAAAEGPEAVSPGGAAVVARVGDMCPTFSWTTATGAERYDLVVYAVGESDTESKELLRRGLPAGSTSWTPSLESCLERGARYAWSIRAMGKKEASEWSAPRLFEVALGPSETQFEEAVELVTSYLALRGENAVSAQFGESGEPPQQEAPESSGPSAPLAPPAATQLSVDGNIHATSFTGNGSNLTGVGNPDPPCFDAARRFADCGNGTVTDGKTGLIYVKNANCFGKQNWVTASQSAAGLADGDCGLTDGSRPGDWRLQTKEEWEEILDSRCISDPPDAPALVGNQSPTSTGCYVDATDPNSAWASNLRSDRYWTSTGGTTQALGCVTFYALCNYSIPKDSSDHFLWPVRGGH